MSERFDTEKLSGKQLLFRRIKWHKLIITTITINNNNITVELHICATGLSALRVLLPTHF